MLATARHTEVLFVLYLAVESHFFWCCEEHPHITNGRGSDSLMGQCQPRVCVVMFGNHPR